MGELFGMNSEGVLAGVLILIVAVLFVMVFGAFALISGWVATYMGLTGVTWWAGAIVIFLLLTGVVLMINRIGSD